MSLSAPTPGRSLLRPAHPAWLVGSIALVAAGLSLRNLSLRLPTELWLGAAIGADGSNLASWVVHYSYLPRLCVSILAGAALALAAAIFQQVLRNPLAEPTTLGVSAGASLAVTVGSLWFPGLAGLGREGIAILGAAGATALVFALAWKRGLSPLSLILAGLIVGLQLGALAAFATLFHTEQLQSVFLWSSGTLRQNDWSAVTYLLPRLAIGIVLAFLMLRPLTILSLDEESGRSLGLSQRSLRFVALAIAIGLSAVVVSAVGLIGFIGLAAPMLARLAGARTMRQQLTWAPLAGGALLWTTDQLVQTPSFVPELPTGVGTAMLGAPLLIWMLPRLRGGSLPPKVAAADVAPRTERPWLLVTVGFILLLAAIWPALDFGRGPSGWHWLAADDLQRLLRWRWPRATAAIAAGAMLAMAGTLMQRLTANPMASPEVLGISSGAACGVIAMTFLAAAPDRTLQIAAAAAGAFGTLLAMLAIGRRSAFSPDRMLLTGIALATAFGALVAVLVAAGDPRMRMLLSWLAGSTYQVTGRDAVTATAVAVVLLPVMPLCSRWLEILPLGDASSRSLGVSLARARFWLLLITALLTGAATLVVGPLSFVGLMAPHMARMLGLQRAMPQLLGAAVLGASIMLVADWLGRNLLFPYQVPAGLVATIVGGPYFIWLLGRR